MGIVMTAVAAKMLSVTLFKDEDSMLVMELPIYHRPLIKNILKSSWQHSSEFLKGACTFITLTVLSVWLLGNLPLGVEYASRESYIGILGTKIAPLFTMAGYGFWQGSVALLMGFLAKEAIIGTMGTLFSADEVSLGTVLNQYFTPAGALSYLVFILLYSPCLSAIVTFKRESNSWNWTLFLVTYMCSIALIISMLTYQLAIRFGYG
jgi:ferrous iron transport protein B